MMFRHSKQLLKINLMTSPIPTSDSPQARLAASRKALVRQMTRANGRPENNVSGDSPEADRDVTDLNINNGRSSTWQVITQAAMAWWQHHPLQIAIDIGRPFLVNYARDKPLQLLSIAASIGAAAVLVKPWRLVSVTGLAVAAFRSTKLSSTLLSLLPRAEPRSSAEKIQQPLKSKH